MGLIFISVAYHLLLPNFRQGGIDIRGPQKKLGKIAGNCGKLRKNRKKKLIYIFWDLEIIAVNPTPLCIVPEVKVKILQVQKGVIQKISTKKTFWVTNEVLVSLMMNMGVLVEGCRFLTLVGIRIN